MQFSFTTPAGAATPGSTFQIWCSAVVVIVIVVAVGIAALYRDYLEDERVAAVVDGFLGLRALCGPVKCDDRDYDRFESSNSWLYLLLRFVR